VQKKDLETGMLYGIMIYRMSGGYEDAAIILADSGKLQSTEEKKHLLLTLYAGEWFENMKSQDLAGSASIPYRRETFAQKQLLIDFDGSFNMSDVAGISANATSKNINQIYHDLDSMYTYNDSVGRAYYKGATHSTLYRPRIKKADSTRVEKMVQTVELNTDSLFLKLSNEDKREVLRKALSEVRMTTSELDYKGGYTEQLHRNTRRHEMEAINKFTLALQCLLFFFIGAPLGAIIRKGGLGVPVILSVLVFITYYIFDNSGMRMARSGEWTVWYGKWVALMVLSPLAIFFTYKANKDSTVFNIDAYTNALFAILGIRSKRNLTRKDVIIDDPAYTADAERLAKISEDIKAYSNRHNLLKAPDPIKVFFKAGTDRRIRDINEELEEVIADLSNTKDPVILQALNSYPIVATHAHTRPFRQKWLNIITGIILPLGLFFYLRMWRFRLRLLKDLRQIKQSNDTIIARIEERHKGK
jgi:lipopolysaccharide export system permease protein